MKNRIIGMVYAIVLVFTGCAKEEIASIRSDKLHPVKFNISTFEKQIVPMAGLNKNIVANASSNNAMPAVLQSLTYVVFDESGKEVSKKVSYASDKNFGLIEDELSEGSYKVTFSGSDKQWVNISNFYGGGMSLHEGGKGDIFYKEIDLIVKGSKEITESVQLARKVGRIEIELLDKITSEVSRIDFTVSKISSYFKLKDHTGTNEYDLKSILFYSNDPQTGTFPDYSQPLYANFFLDRDLPAVAVVSIQAYDNDWKIIADKVILDVPVAINKKTILIGKLFDETPKGQQFSVTLDDNWNSETININY